MGRLVCLNPCFNGRYSRSYAYNQRNYFKKWVLILVLMEDTLGGIKKSSGRRSKNLVLILVLMEDTLGVLVDYLKREILLVLILVLMEDTLGEVSEERSESS